MTGFEAAMAKQKATARASWSVPAIPGLTKLWFELRDELGATDFLGYSTEKAEGQVTALVRNGTRPRPHTEQTAVKHVRNPGERVPVAGVERGKCPGEICGRRPGNHVRVAGDIGSSS